MSSPLSPRDIHSPLLYPRQYAFTSPICPRPGFFAHIPPPRPHVLSHIPSSICRRLYPSAHPYGHMPSPRFPHQYPLFSLTPIPSLICLRHNALDHIPSPHPYVIAPITSPISPRPSYYVFANFPPHPYPLTQIPLPLSPHPCLSPSPHPYVHMYDLTSLPLCACSLHNIPSPHQYDLFRHDIHHHYMCHDHMLYHHINTTYTTHQHQSCK